MAYWQDIPLEIQIMIIRMLEVKDRMRMGSTCKQYLFLLEEKEDPKYHQTLSFCLRRMPNYRILAFGNNILCNYQCKSFKYDWTSFLFNDSFSAMSINASVYEHAILHGPISFNILKSIFDGITVVDLTFVGEMRNGLPSSKFCIYDLKTKPEPVGFVRFGEIMYIEYNNLSFITHFYPSSFAIKESYTRDKNTLVLHGPYRQYYLSGYLTVKGVYHNGIPSNQWEFYYDLNTLPFETHVISSTSLYCRVSQYDMPRTTSDQPVLLRQFNLKKTDNETWVLHNIYLEFYKDRKIKLSAFIEYGHVHKEIMISQESYEYNNYIQPHTYEKTPSATWVSKWNPSVKCPFPLDNDERVFVGFMTFTERVLRPFYQLVYEI